MLSLVRTLYWNEINERRHVLNMFGDFLEDAFFAAIAAIGFASISNPPRNAFIYCAVIAAVGHSSRFLMMQPCIANMNIVPASIIAACIIGFLAMLLSPHAKTPAETFLFPSLLPMIPGIYAYKTFGSMLICLFHNGETDFMHYFYLFASNGFTCLFIILGMVIGATAPIFLLKRISFQATR